MYYKCVVLVTHVYVCKCVVCQTCGVKCMGVYCVFDVSVGTLCVVCDVRICMCVCVCMCTISMAASSNQGTNSSPCAWDFPDFSTESPYRSPANLHSWSAHSQHFSSHRTTSSSVQRCVAPSAGCSRTVQPGCLGPGLQTPFSSLHFTHWGLPFPAPLQDTQGILCTVRQ